jgi:hypothetical protein
MIIGSQMMTYDGRKVIDGLIIIQILMQLFSDDNDYRQEEQSCFVLLFMKLLYKNDAQYSI